MTSALPGPRVDPLQVMQARPGIGRNVRKGIPARGAPVLGERIEGGQAWFERLRQPAVIVQFSRLMSTHTSEPGQVSALGITMPWMFVPGNKQRMLDKALGLHVDAIMMDLEDGVAPAWRARLASASADEVLHGIKQG